MADISSEDVRRGDRTTQGLLGGEVPVGQAEWTAKQAGVIAGLPMARRVFQLLSDRVGFVAVVGEGEECHRGQLVACVGRRWGER